MKALTVQNPWAWAIIHGGKNIENRTQLWRYRGPLAIHAGARWSASGLASPLVLRAFTSQRRPRPRTAGSESTMRRDLAAAAIIGVVGLVDCHPDSGCCRPWGESVYREYGGRRRSAVAHLVLEDPRALPEPIPCRGALGLWTPGADVVAAVLAQVSHS